MNVNVDLMEENVTQINGEIMINVDVNVKNAMYVKKIMFRIDEMSIKTKAFITISLHK